MAPVILFAPGAGAPSGSPWMTAWAERLRGLGGPVRTMGYPYQRAGRSRPDRHDVLLSAHRDALDAAREAHPGRPVVLAGKSMGGRIGCHLSLEAPVAGLVCFGYPLVSRSGAVRDEVLVALTAPILFAQGTRDPLCALARLAEVRARMTARSELEVVQAGDHSLLVTKTEAKVRSQAEHDADVLEAVRRFVASL